MVVVTIAFPDERSSGMDHLHSTFPTRTAAYLWCHYMIEAFGHALHYEIMPTDETWTCPECHHTIRNHWKEDHKWFGTTWNGEV